MAGAAESLLVWLQDAAARCADSLTERAARQDFGRTDPMHRSQASPSHAPHTLALSLYRAITVRSLTAQTDATTKGFDFIATQTGQRAAVLTPPKNQMQPFVTGQLGMTIGSLPLGHCLPVTLTKRRQ